MSSGLGSSAISCEPCRQRKCKCDRELPACKQCSSQPSRCVYHESGKRGLPPGYLNQLEQRLADTEAALYGALVTLRQYGLTPTTPHPFSQHKSSPKSKADRVLEWHRLPLHGWSDMERWMAGASPHFDPRAHQSASGPSSKRPSGQAHITQGLLESQDSCNRLDSCLDSNPRGPAISHTWIADERLSQEIAPPHSRAQAPPSLSPSTQYSQTVLHESTPEVLRSIRRSSDQTAPFDLSSEGGRENLRKNEPVTQAQSLSEERPDIYF